MAAPPIDNREAYSPAETCERCGFGMTTFYKEVAEGRLRAKKLRKKTLVLRNDLRDYLQALPNVIDADKPDDQPHDRYRRDDDCERGSCLRPDLGNSRAAGRHSPLAKK